MLKTIFFAFILLTSNVSAYAGQLFPPKNLYDAGVPNAACPNGQVLGWEAGGVINCVNPTSGVTVPPCPAGTVFSGISAGAAVCTPAVTSNCPAGQVQIGMNNGTPVCSAPPSASINVSCPAGQVLSGINNGSPVCASPAAASISVTCPAGQVLQGISNGTPVCTLAGGTYATAGAYAEGLGGFRNAFTNNYSCPAGFHPVQIFAGTNSCYGCRLYLCYRN